MCKGVGEYVMSLVESGEKQKVEVRENRRKGEGSDDGFSQTCSILCLSNMPRMYAQSGYHLPKFSPRFGPVSIKN